MQQEADLSGAQYQRQSEFRGTRVTTFSSAQLSQWVGIPRQSLCAGALWLMPAWVWRDVRSIFFSPCPAMVTVGTAPCPSTASQC